MTLEERMAALEERIAITEEKREAMQDEAIALRALVTTLLPVIAASATVPLDAAIDASVIRATRVLQHAGWPPARIARVVAELALLREDMGENDAEESSPWH